MNALISLLKSQLQCDDFTLSVSPDWAAANREDRLKLRQALVAKINQHLKARNPPSILNRNEEAGLLDLSAPPSLPGFSISLSHCQAAGGLVFSSQGPYSLGLDLEETNRVSSKIVGRMSEPDELAQASHPALLWAAKEATFKSLLGPLQPTILSAVRITDWQPLGPHIWLFSWEIQGLSGLTGQGLAAHSGPLTIAIAKYLPQLSSSPAR